MTVLHSESMELHTPEDIVLVRQAVRKKAVALGFGLVDQTKVVTASSELARNMLNYGGGGTVQLEVVQNDRRSGLRLVFEDHGPGIADIEQAMKDGYTSGQGMGLGAFLAHLFAQTLGGQLSFESAPGHGCTATLELPDLR